MTSVRMAPGLGIITDVVVDQHFRERGRIGRLITTVLLNPSMLGFGLDENTAFAMDADGQVAVYGSGTLTVVDGAGLEANSISDVPEEQPAAFAGIRLHALGEGWIYDLARRQVVPPLLASPPSLERAAGD